MTELRLKLFVFGETPPSRRAITAIEELCREFSRECRLKVVDIATDPEQAERYNILATPTLLREEPVPLKRIIGNMADRQHLLAALELDLEQ